MKTIIKDRLKEEVVDLIVTMKHGERLIDTCQCRECRIVRALAYSTFAQELLLRLDDELDGPDAETVVTAHEELLNVVKLAHHMLLQEAAEVARSAVGGLKS